MSWRRALHALIGEDEVTPQAPPPVATHLSPPSKRPRWWKTRLFFSGILLAVLAGLIIAIVLYTAPPPPLEGPQSQRPRDPKVGAIVDTTAPEPTRVVATTPTLVGTNRAPPPLPPAQTLSDKAYGQEFAAFGGKAIPSASAGGQGAAGAGGQEDAKPEPGSAMDAALRIGRTPTAQARVVSNPHLKMRPNTPIECAMDNVSDNGTGFISGSCTVTQHAYSMTGSVRLIPRDSTITIRGERTGANGDTRIMLTAATAIVKYDGIRHPIEIDIMAAVADALGATGVEGTRDDRTRERLLSAVLLGISGEASSRVGARLTAEDLPGAGVVRGASTVGSRGLQYQTQIRPHVTVRQGEAIAVVLQGYADFSNQLELAVIR